MMKCIIHRAVWARRAKWKSISRLFNCLSSAHEAHKCGFNSTNTCSITSRCIKQDKTRCRLTGMDNYATPTVSHNDFKVAETADCGFSFIYSTLFVWLAPVLYLFQKISTKNFIRRSTAVSTDMPSEQACISCNSELAPAAFLSQRSIKCSCQARSCGV